MRRLCAGCRGVGVTWEASRLMKEGTCICHGPRLKLKTRAALRPLDVFFGCQRSALTLTNAVLGLNAPASYQGLGDGRRKLGEKGLKARVILLILNGCFTRLMYT